VFRAAVRNKSKWSTRELRVVEDGLRVLWGALEWRPELYDRLRQMRSRAKGLFTKLVDCGAMPYELDHWLWEIEKARASGAVTTIQRRLAKRAKSIGTQLLRLSTKVQSFCEEAETSRLAPFDCDVAKVMARASAQAEKFASRGDARGRSRYHDLLAGLVAHVERTTGAPRFRELSLLLIDLKLLSGNPILVAKTLEQLARRRRKGTLKLPTREPGPAMAEQREPLKKFFRSE
jgi:hypothetical protein